MKKVPTKFNIGALKHFTFVYLQYDSVWDFIYLVRLFAVRFC